MKSFFCALVLLIAQTAMAAERGKIGIVNVLGNEVSIQLDKGWQILSEKKRDDGLAYVVSLVPKGDDGKSWRRLITVQGYGGTFASIGKSGMLDNMRETLSSLCEEKVKVEVLSNKKISEASAIEVVLSCGKMRSPSSAEHPARATRATIFETPGGELLVLFFSANDKSVPIASDLSKMEYAERFLEVRMSMGKRVAGKVKEGDK